MKAFNKYLAVLILLSVVLFSSCDYVSNPHQPSTSGTTTGNAVVVRKMFVEDYTGHKCDNCPRAARTLHSLKDGTYHENMIIVSIHAGGFTSTTPLNGDLFPTDLTTPTGNTYFNLPDFGFISNPAFMVNRKDVPTQNSYVSESGLSAACAGANGLTPNFKLEIFNSYNSSTRNLTTRVKSTALNTISGTYKLVILLTEDSVIAEQLDKYATPNYVPNYIHRDVLRAAINSDWGSQVFTTSITANDTASITISNFAISSNFNENHCSVVAYLYDADLSSNHPTAYEVLQAEEKKIK